MSKSFSATIEDWARETEQRMTAIFRESTQRMIGIATDYISGDLVKVQTGFLRASVRVSLSEMPEIDPSAEPAEGQRYGVNAGQVSVQIASAQAGDTIYAGYTAAYAGFVHDGTSKMAGRPWVDMAAVQWQTVVNGVQQDLKARLRV